MNGILTYEKTCLVRRLWALSPAEVCEAGRIATWLDQIRRYLAVYGGNH